MADTYKGNPNLKGAGAEINFTEEQVKEFIKCSKNPIYLSLIHI